MEGVMQHGCRHYRRRCKLISPCCGEVVWCRLCHDEATKADPLIDTLSSGCSQILDRKAVKEVGQF